MGQDSVHGNEAERCERAIESLIAHVDAQLRRAGHALHEARETPERTTTTDA